MDLKSAEVICERALEVAAANKLNPMTVSVMDAGGHLILFKRQDGSSLLRESIARGKATAALGLGMDSAKLAKMASDRPMFVNSAIVASAGKLIPVPGGVLVHDAAGKLIGAVGISGDLSDADEWCAIEGIKKAGLNCAALKESRAPYLKAHL
jgi:uncharacterized protein GlcG (DUF336 family)